MARRTKSDDFHFEGFESPNTTPVPDVVFDRLLARLGEAELKALLYIIRRTFGFKKDRDPISFNQFLKGITTLDGRNLDEGCGVKDRTTLSKALKSLEAKGIVISEKGTDDRGENTTTVYRLRFRSAEAAPQGVVGNSYHPGMNPPPPVVGNSYPQETDQQETVRQISKNRKNANDENKRITHAVGSTNEGKANTVSVRQASGAAMSETISLAEAIARRQHQPAAPPGPATKAQDERSRRATVPRRRGRPRTPVYDEDRQVLLAYVTDFSREFNDRAPLTASVTRAYNLLRSSGLSRDAFIDRLYQARAITKERSASVRSQAGKDALGLPTTNKMAYFFAVLESLLTEDPGNLSGPN